VLRLLAEVVHDAGAPPTDGSVQQTAQAVADTTRPPGVALVDETAGKHGTADVRLAGCGHAVFEVTVDRSPATMAPAAVPSREGAARVGGIPSRRRWRPFVRHYPGVDLPGRLVREGDSQARCSLCPFGIYSLTALPQKRFFIHKHGSEPPVAVVSIAEEAGPKCRDASKSRGKCGAVDVAGDDSVGQ
jgi:hypothetical protein